MMMKLFILLVFGCFISAFADIHSCGGYVRSSIPFDYSKIQVKLLTPEGHMKHEEELNAANGYYMIPIYNKGKYTLRVSAPEGWFFEPEKIEINLDGTTDPCSKNEDINFSLTAFSINGVVEGGSEVGPSGLPLTLNQNGKVIASTTTDSQGKYSFKAPPGVYEVAASTSSAVCISHGSSKVEVKNSPVTVLPNLKISGYQMSISAKNRGQALPGVSIQAFSNSNKLSGCKANSDKASKWKFVCVLGKTSASGSLELPCAPIGSYELVPNYESEITSFSFSPRSVVVDITNDKKSANFEVSGFSGKGRVVATSKKFDGAEIVLNGKTVTKSDKTGQYTLSELKEGSVEITARAPKTQFSTVKANLRLPNIEIPAVTVESYELCGSVEKVDGKAEGLTLVNKKSGASVTITPSQDGSFCKFVAPAKYTISPADSTSSLTPRSLDIDLTNEPVDGLRFTHYKTDAEVSVTCIDSCGSISLTLLSGDTVIQTANGADVTFKDIGPGQYTVRLSDDGLGCWAKKELPLLVERARPQPVHFVQEGFVTSVRLSHPAKLTWSHSGNKPIKGEMKAEAGVSKICVPLQGKYNIQVESCMEFVPTSLDISVPSVVVAEMTAVSARVSGMIVSEDNRVFNVKVKSSNGEKMISTVQGVFKFNEPLATEGDIILVPTSDTHLFDPASFVFKFNGKCSEKVVDFVAAKGIFVEGKITPAVEGAQITAVHKLDSNVVFNTLSDKNGKFRVGPVRRADDLSISAELDGYSFSAEGQIGGLKSVKLSQISVSIVDAATSDGLDGVLLSVVGGKEYRSNNMVKPTGKINFVGLAPGDYFLRPILQEYKFEPSTTTVTVKEGEHQQVVLKGKRVAYSVWGKVREMSGQALPGVTLEALSEKCDHHQSEAVTCEEGSFRIRGLKPGCHYRVGIKADTNGPHCFPSQFDIQMTSEDVKGLEMVASPRNEKLELAVEVEFGTTLSLTSYRVEVSKQGEVVAQSVQSAPTSVYYLTGLPRDGSEYSVRIEPDKPAQAFHAKTVFFTADAPVRVVRVPVSSSRKASEVEIGMGSVLALPFFALVILVVFNQNKALEISKSFYENFSQSNSPSRDRRRRK